MTNTNQLKMKALKGKDETNYQQHTMEKNNEIQSKKGN